MKSDLKHAACFSSSTIPHLSTCLNLLLYVPSCHHHKINEKIRNGQKDSGTLSAVFLAGFTGSFEAQVLFERKSEILR